MHVYPSEPTSDNDMFNKLMMYLQTLIELQREGHTVNREINRVNQALHDLLRLDDEGDSDTKTIDHYNIDSIMTELKKRNVGIVREHVKSLSYVIEESDGYGESDRMTGDIAVIIVKR